jgi:cell wall-associated NlpC family hydrolase
LAVAKSYLGVPYRYGGSSRSGVDCSGLTMVAWKAAGVSLAHSSRSQYRSTPRVPRSQLKPGDLVFYYGDIHHVAIYAGKGLIIHAPHPGADVEYADLDDMPYRGAGRPG